MKLASLFTIARVAWGPVFGLAALALVGVSPVAAQSTGTCVSGSTIQVWLINLTQDQDGHQGIILTSQPDGSFSGTFQVQVVCSTGPTLVTNAQVGICSVIPTDPTASSSLRVSAVGFDPTGVNPSVNTPPETANCSIDSNGVVTGQAANVNLPYGIANVTITSSDPLPANTDFAWVGREGVIVTSAYGQSLQVGSTSTTTTYSTTPAFSPGIWAQTPELDSLLLFGSGAAGMAGYAIMRLRASRRRED
jgi:hypothetical protein